MTATPETSALMFSHEARVAQTVVLVDGIVRSGKSMIAPIISSYERIEMLRVDETLDLTTALYEMGQVSRDAAVAMLRMKTDINLYNGLIGRDTNLRFGDYSSIWKNSNLWRNLKRLRSPEGKSVMAAVDKNRPIYQQTTHNQLSALNIFVEAFGTEFRNIQMIRHPASLIDSWMRRDWGSRIGTDPLAFTLCIQHRGQDLPYYALGWEDLYLSSSPAGRIVRIIGQLWDRNQSAYEAADEANRQQVFFIPFEDFAQRPSAHLRPLADFLGSATTKKTPGAVKRENCPRTLPANVEKTIRSIEDQVNPEESAILHRLIDEYETLAQTYTR